LAEFRGDLRMTGVGLKVLCTSQLYYYLHCCYQSFICYDSSFLNDFLFLEILIELILISNWALL
jgi:hypothetical protein